MTATADDPLDRSRDRTSGEAPDQASERAPDSSLDALVRVGERFGGTVRLSVDEVRRYAHSIGDHNPLHHDEARARASRFGGLIASGPQVGSLMMGMFATHFTRSDDGVGRSALGMGFDIRFKAPVRPDDDIVVEWHVVERHFKPRLGGWIATVDGTARSARHGLLIGCVGTVLVTPAEEIDRPAPDTR
jgi:acyl dehydratase